MQSRLYINGREVQSTAARRLAAALVPGIPGLFFLALAIALLSVIGLGIAVGAGIAGTGLGGPAIRRAISGRREQKIFPAEHPRLKEKKEE